MLIFLLDLIDFLPSLGIIGQILKMNLLENRFPRAADCVKR